MRNKLFKKATALAMSLLMLGMMGCIAADDPKPTDPTKEQQTNNGDIAESTDPGFVVTLTTDKNAYNEGEKIHYTLKITNNIGLHTISKVTVKPSNSAEISGNEPSFSGAVVTGESVISEGDLTVDASKLSMSSVTSTGKAGFSAAAFTEGASTVSVRPYVTVNYGGNELTVRYIMEITYFQNKVTINAADKKKISNVSVHDPSIIVGTDPQGQKCYYIFGSHLAWAKSYDLENWTSFKNNLNTSYNTILAPAGKWTAHSGVGLSGYMWAPDVIWNEAMQKWCMYLSVDGDSWYSVIVMLTADSLEGDWTYVDEIVFSGFGNQESDTKEYGKYYDETDVAMATGETTIADRYKLGRAWGNTFPNCIDACVFYDEEGKLWMSYGSWSGGIFLLELDENTGLRDYTVTYQNNKHSDAYFGTKIAGGQYVSGEASYIQYYGGYYWLFISYGALEAKGGYNVRVFRSKSPNSPFYDEAGNMPFFDSYEKNHNSPVGVRLFGGYKWRTMSTGQVAQGHNSAFVDDDGKMYIVYHTRTTDGTEGHRVETHQLFLNEDGWLVAAPYSYGGETLDEKGVSASEFAGTYEVITHSLNIDYANLETKKPVLMEFHEDGTVTGTKQSGTWELVAGTPYVNITLGDELYKGVALKMDIEDTTVTTMVFTILGTENQVTVWGSKSID